MFGGQLNTRPRQATQKRRESEESSFRGSKGLLNSSLTPHPVEPTSGGRSAHRTRTLRVPPAGSREENPRAGNEDDEAINRRPAHPAGMAGLTSLRGGSPQKAQQRPNGLQQPARSTDAVKLVSIGATDAGEGVSAHPGVQPVSNYRSRLSATADRARSTNSATDKAPRSLPLRSRTATEAASTSRSPTINM